MAQIGYGGFLGVFGSTSDINSGYTVDAAGNIFGNGNNMLSFDMHRTLLLGIIPDVKNSDWDSYKLTETSDPGNIGIATLGPSGGLKGLDGLSGFLTPNQNDNMHDRFTFTLDTSSTAWKNLAVGKSLTVSYRIDATENLSLLDIVDPTTSDSLYIKFTFTKTCFDAQTMILMADGSEKAAAGVVVGDLVATADHGAQPVRWVGRNVITPAEIEHFPSWRPVRIAAGALGNGLPIADLTVSQLHRVILRGDVAREAFGTDELLIPARFLTALDGIDLVEADAGADLVHFMFDNHEIVTSNGARSESFCVSPLSRSQIGAEQLAELETLFPELAEMARNGRHELARPVAREGIAEGIVAQLRDRALPVQ